MRKMLFLSFAFLAIIPFVFLVFRILFQFSEIRLSHRAEISPSIDIFAEKRTLPQKPAEVLVMAVGDISYSRAVERAVRRYGSIQYPFLHVQEYLQGGDIVFGNLETPITEGKEIPDFHMIFRSNPGTELALKTANFSLVSLANNHTMDFGERGLLDTMRYLDESGIRYVGAGKTALEAYAPVFIDRHGIRFAFLAYTDPSIVPKHYGATDERAGSAFMQIDAMTDAVKNAKRQSDIVVVSMHAGTEYVEEPNALQVSFARAAIDAGADLVLGHHPHVIQPIERYKEKLIVYSLGNFIFDQPHRQDTRQSMIAIFHVTTRGVEKASFIPLFMEQLAQPQLVEGYQAEEIHKRLRFPFDERVAHSWDASLNDFKGHRRATIYLQKAHGSFSLSKEEFTDVDHDDMKEIYRLRQGRLVISESARILWESPEDWWVDDMHIFDRAHDEEVEMSMSVWKAEVSDALSDRHAVRVGNYLVVFRMRDGEIKTMWSSSRLSSPLCEIAVADINEDGKVDIVALEGEYADYPNCVGRRIVVWNWSEERLIRQWQSKEGRFSDLSIESLGGKRYIVADSFSDE